MTLKGNQGTLEEEVESIFRVQKPDDAYCDLEKNRGRIESRTCQVIQNLEYLEGKKKWKGLKSIIKIPSLREIGPKKSTKTRLYISSLEHSAKERNQYIRSNWAIENSLHWTLDMTFNEDRQRKRDKNTTQNFAQAQKIAMNLLKNEGSKKISIKTKRLKAAWDNNFLAKILGFYCVCPVAKSQSITNISNKKVSLFPGEDQGVLTRSILPSLCFMRGIFV